MKCIICGVEEDEGGGVGPEADMGKWSGKGKVSEGGGVPLEMEFSILCTRGTPIGIKGIGGCIIPICIQGNMDQKAIGFGGTMGAKLSCV